MRFLFVHGFTFFALSASEQFSQQSCISCYVLTPSKLDMFWSINFYIKLGIRSQKGFHNQDVGFIIIFNPPWRQLVPTVTCNDC